MYAITQSGMALSPSEDENGDIFIGDDFEQNELAITGNLNGNLTIRAGGVVTISNGALTVLATERNMAYMIIEDGGKLILDNAVLETEDVLTGAQMTLAILVRNGGSVVADDSELNFNGSIVVDQASFIITGTSMDGPLFTAISSNVEMYDSTVSNIPGTPTNVNQTYSYPFVDTYNASSQVTYTLERNPDAAQTVVPSGEDTTDLLMNDSGYVTLNTDEQITISGFDIGGLVLDEGDAVSVVLKAEYRTTDDFTSASPDTFYYFEYLDSTPDPANDMLVNQTYENYNASTTNHDVTLSQVLTSLDLSSLDMSVLSVTFNNSNENDVYIDRVWLEVTVVYDAQCNMTFAGSSEFTAVNTAIDVNYLDYTNTTLGAPNYRKLVLTDTAQANLYDVSVNGEFEVGDTNINPFIVESKTLTFKPLEQGGDDTTLETNVLNLLSNDDVYYDIPGTDTLHVLLNTAGLHGKISSSTIAVNYLCDIGYDSEPYVQWNITGSSLVNTSISLVSEDDVSASHVIARSELSNISQASLINIIINNPDALGIGIDEITLTVTLDPSFNIYRAVNVSVLDSNDLPVNGAYVNATNCRGGLPALYYSGDLVGDVPCDKILDYLGKDVDTYTRTNDSGLVTLFLLTDTVNSNWVSYPNSYTYNYHVNVEYNEGGDVYTTNDTDADFPAYPDLTILSMSMEFALTTLELELPDITLDGFATDPTTIYEGDTVTLNFNVINNGLTTAKSFNVTIADVFGSGSVVLQNITVASLAAGATMPLSITWNSSMTIAGVHTIVITADSEDVIFETDEDDLDGLNNNIMSTSVTVLRYLPDLSITESSIVFSQNPGYANQAMYINVTISNMLGRAAATGAIVNFYLGNPSDGGILIGTTTLDVLASTTNLTSILWTPTQIGTYSIYVTVNEDRSFVEYLYTNNVASDSLEVILIANETDGDLIFDYEYNMTAPSFSWQGNIVVEDEGYLTFYGTAVTMRDPETRIIQIMVRDDATLELIGGSITANFDLIIYLFDNATLKMTNSGLLGSVDVIMDDNATVLMDGSWVRGDLHAPITANVTLVAYNSTFDKAISDFGGSSIATLVAATVSSTTPVSPRDEAIIYLYSWVTAIVMDGTGDNTIAGAYVQVNAFPSTWYTAGETDDDGRFTIQALSAIVTADTIDYYGSYILNATYWYEGTAYQSDKSVTAQVLYVPTQSLARSDKYVQLDISSAKPDIDPPFTVSEDTPLRGSAVTLSTIISNGGVVSAYNVLVRFTDTSSSGTVIIEDYVIDELAANTSVTVDVTWIASYPIGADHPHNLSVMVDPLNAIPELNESNNLNYTQVIVQGVSDLTVSASDVSIGSSNPARDQATTISASVTNLGDFTASAFDVTFYDGNTLIDTYQISNIPTGEAVDVIISWTPTTAGNHTIRVILDEAGVVNESSEANNQVNKTVGVSDYPDLVAVGISFVVEGTADDEAFVGDDVSIVLAVFNDGDSAAYDFNVTFWNGNELIGIVSVDSLDSQAQTSVSIDWNPTIDASHGQYQNLVITAQINMNATDHIMETDYTKNEAFQTLEVIDNRPDLRVDNVSMVSMGDNVTSGVNGEVITVSFDVENIGIVASGTIAIQALLIGNNQTVILGNYTDNIAVGDLSTFSFTWTIGSSVGDYDLVFQVNATSDANTTNNQMTVDFDVLIVDPVFKIATSGKTNFEPGNIISVTGTLTRLNNSAPLVGQIVSVVLTDESGFELTAAYNYTTNAKGEFRVSISTPSGNEGTQYVTASIYSSERTFNDEVAINIVAPFTPESVPSWVYLLIVAMVIAVIVVFSFYLYKVGLGRMVECGNCGALIPEASSHCPKCGVEFEVGTAKCSECGAWIPAKAESCPECGSKFMTEPVEMEQGTGYIESMRKQYDEYIDGFRTQAKTALGSKYSEEKFQEWLQTEPNYLPFEEWLRKEEMAKKSGVFPCPSCGTLNPRESKVCHRCGTVFEEKAAGSEEAKAPAKAEEKKSPFRRIVRKSPKEQAPEQPAEAPKEPAEEAKPVEEEKKTE